MINHVGAKILELTISSCLKKTLHTARILCIAQRTQFMRIGGHANMAKLKLLIIL